MSTEQSTQEEAQAVLDLRAVLGTQFGFDTMVRIMAHIPHDQDDFHPDPHMRDYNAGRRSAGLTILRMLRAADPMIDSKLLDRANTLFQLNEPGQIV